VLESAIEALDDLSKLTPLLTNLGRIHTKQQQLHGFDPCYWIIFRDCTLYQFRREFSSSSDFSLICSCQSTIREHEVDSMVALWRELIEYIIQGMKIYFFECVKSREEMRKIMDTEGDGSISAKEFSSIRSNDMAVLSKSTT
uniref:Globin family profile domain-containing protein n=1 Tax=Parascaris univalens TaxID=6257 RepID=A0A914ZT60_PARUN